jgi:hypothetical protein
MLKCLLKPANESMFKRFYSIRWCLIDGSANKEQRSLIKNCPSDMISPSTDSPNDSSSMFSPMAFSSNEDSLKNMNVEAFIGLFEGIFKALTEQCDFIY